MIKASRRSFIILLVLVLAAVMGRFASLPIVALLVAVPAGLILIREPRCGLLILPVAALLIPLEIGTGREVTLNPAVVVVPTVAAAWLAPKLLSFENISLTSSRLNYPLMAFLLVTLFSLLRGNLMWDPFVPRPGNMILVQLGQISIYTLSFVSFWLTANLATNLVWLRRIAYALIMTGAVAVSILFFQGSPLQKMLLPRGLSLLSGIWIVTLSLALGLYDQRLKPWQRILLFFIVAETMIWLWIFQRSLFSSWVPPLISIGAIIWWHASRLKWLVVISAVLMLVIIGFPFLIREINQNLDLEAEWDESGGSRLTLWTSVIKLGSQSPVLGLGPAAYRHYHYLKPLTYKTAMWFRPTVSAHNQFVDLFAQLGLLGVVCYIWFLIEAILLATELYNRYTGLAQGYALAMKGAIVGIATTDMFAENFLPFVYNMGFWGFRASVLGWMLLGGLAVLENLNSQPQATNSHENSQK